ncbi:WD40-repeat-containing domain protein [Tricharina praecox]|uniref:WD40-repeat-containing domain protein n=1 Tax=Tricharina praecox TaxID=43433 RepID=UPI00221F1D43|nr:WD40-repeat-containing domain protein [Tricharina praecox]KAI5858863.1 WD40-repeat-containing domain protein [Tricharina praecox]
MLYSADIFVGSDGGVTVAAGTVFGEIIVWSWNGESLGRVTRRLRGHEGSVFAVKFDDEMRWLASCSDDRTVRVWDLMAREGDGDGGRETTGFGEVVGEAKGGRGCVGMGWGHQARPWGVRFLPAEAGQVRLVSISEDLTAKFWGFAPKPEETATMEITKSWLLHQGKSIWAFAIDTERELMASGGNDGRVGLVDYSDDAEVHQDWLFEDVITPPPTPPTPVEEKKKKKNKPMDGFKNYAVVDSERFIATTVYGQVMLHNMRNNTWKSLGSWDALVKWSAIRVWEGNAVLAVGDNEGKLGIFDIDNDRSWWWEGGGRGKVADVFVNYFQVITTSVGAAAFTLHSFMLREDGEPIRHSVVLLSPAPQRFIVTSALVSQRTRQVFLGSRTGDLAVYALPAPESAGLELQPTSYHSELYSTDAITCITLSPTSPTTLYTTSFTGVYTIHTLPSLEATHITRPGNITNIVGLFFTAGSLHLYGFRGTRFVVYNTVTSSDTLSIECGGGHRAWTFSPSALTPWFIWTQATRLQLNRSIRPRHAVLKYGSHGREIKTVAYSPTTRLLATGAEDTTIRISFVAADGTVREPGAVTVKRHTTGVLHLEWSADGKRLFSSGGVEELLVFRVRVDNMGCIGIVEESFLPVPKQEAETRICGLDVLQRDRVHYVAAGMSDGFVRVWTYNGNVWTLKGMAAYGSCCLLHAKFLPLGGDDGKIALLVAATDGHLAIYDVGELAMRQVWRQRVHQSGIKALSVDYSLDSGKITFFTGGDDCAIASIAMEYSHNQWKSLACTLVDRAHTSAVTAILPVAGGVITAGVDQRVKIWNRRLEALGGVSSMVADLGGAVTVDTDDGVNAVVVVGVGIETWKVGEINGL